ncbi:MAG: hypothetical protein MK101_09765 [Phycisphaerales bacterium]|nr:hypothetical protein [Phycisphaerales bacterium]
MIIRLSISLMLCLVVAAQAMAYPKPSPIPTRPELTFRPGPLRIVQAKDGNRYWYFTYEVVNRTGSDAMWAPSMVLFTDRGEIAEAGQGVPRTVLREIQEYIGDPLLESRTEIIGTIRQGEGHARRGLAVWPVGNSKVNGLRLFVRGLSPELATVQHPVTGAPITLRKTLQLVYLAPGDVTARRDAPIPEHPEADQEDRWIFR